MIDALTTPNMGHLSKTSKFLADLVIYNKYANYLPDLRRRQVWEECVTVLMEMHIKQYPKMEKEIRAAFDMVYTKQVLPSMRSIQFGGIPIEFSPNRIFNCAYAPIDHYYVFAEFLFLLLGGTGEGYSVRSKHVSQLPEIVKPEGTRRYLIGDSIEGWADSIKALMAAYMKGKPLPKFDYRDIRPKGAPIKKTGGRAPGHTSLEYAHNKVNQVLNQAIGRKLTTLETHDIVCFIADCVLAGGVREAALIALFDLSDMDMMTSKGMFKCSNIRILENNPDSWLIKVTLMKDQIMNTNCYNGTDEQTVYLSKQFGAEDFVKLTEHGELAWYYLHPQRGRANNSVALLRGQVTYEQFREIWQRTEDAKSGDPGILWVNNEDDGTNPCFTGDMMLLTKNGYKSFRDLWMEGGKQDYSKEKTAGDYGMIDITNKNGVVKATNVYRTAKLAEVFRVELKDGSVFDATERHRFPVMENGVEVTKRVNELQVGDSFIRSNQTIFGTFHYPEYAELAGWVIGDGSISKTSDGKRQRAHLRFWNDDITSVMPSLKPKLQTVYETSNTSSNQSPKYVSNDMNTTGFDHKAKNIESIVLGRLLHDDGVVVGSKHRVPQNIWKGDKETVAAFIKGLFSADGSVQISNYKRSISIRLGQTSDSLLREIKLLLTQFGIQSSVLLRKVASHQMMNDGKGGKKLYNRAAMYELIISGIRNCQIYEQNIGFIQEYKNNKLSEWLQDHKGSNNSIVKLVSLVSKVTNIGKQEVFCLTEPLTNEIVVNGYNSYQCSEIGLIKNQFCNLTTAVVYNTLTQKQLNEQMRVAAFIGTLQAGYTDFHYLRPIWKEATEKDALIGVSMTGVASGRVLPLNLVEAAGIVVEENKRVAARIGINPAARATCMKPEGTGTLAAGVMGSGIHAIHSEYLIRNVRIKKHNPIYGYLMSVMPEYVHDEFLNEANGAVVAIPMKAPEGVILRSESTFDMLERIKRFSTDWVKPGHMSGAQSHNVSATVTVDDGDWSAVADWMWENREFYNGITVLPRDNGSYKQAPFEEITHEEYEDRVRNFPKFVDFTAIEEEAGHVNLLSELACAAGNCEVK